MTDNDIIKLYCSGRKEEAFNGIVDAYTERLYWHIRRFLGSHEDTNDLLQDVFEVASTEQRIKFNEARAGEGATQYHGLTVWTPNINIFRDPRWGRGQETYGEDPYLMTVMGRSVVNGLRP